MKRNLNYPALQAAVADVEEAISTSALGGGSSSGRAQQAACAPQAWARALALLLGSGAKPPASAAVAPSASPAAGPQAGERECGEAVGEALRVLLAGGVVAAIASAAGPGARLHRACCVLCCLVTIS